MILKRVDVGSVKGVPNFWNSRGAKHLPRSPEMEPSISQIEYRYLDDFICFDFFINCHFCPLAPQIV